MSRLEARSIGKSYGSVSALKGVSLEAEAGRILCVLGASGGGKSTLIRNLHLLESPDAGEVRVDDAPVQYGGAAWLETVRRFSLVQQNPGLLRAPAWRNVAFPLRARGLGAARARAEALAWLEWLGLEGRVESFPAQLSGGEAQRVAVARALVTRPDFLLVDEGTNQLDPHGVRNVERVVRDEAKRGCVVVLVTHNVPQALRLADSFVFLDQGRIVEAGDRERLRRPRTDALRLFLETG